MTLYFDDNSLHTDIKTIYVLQIIFKLYYLLRNVTCSENIDCINFRNKLFYY